MSEAPALVWFREDLRLADNPALAAAAATQRPVLCVYVLDDATPGRWKLGGASRWWLHRSLAALQRDVAKRGGRLILRQGDAARHIPLLAAHSGAASVHWNRRYEPYAIARDTLIKQVLNQSGIEAHSYNGALLIEPWEIRTKGGEPFKVFTPFWRACLASGAFRTPAAAPAKLNLARADTIESEDLADWRLLPVRPNWAKGFEVEWAPGEAGARAALARFAPARLAAYPSDRDQLAAPATSRLSPHLHFGEISPAQVLATLPDAPGADKFISELGWREFAHHLLFHWPNLHERNWRAQFDGFPWREDEDGFRAWTRGATGYPVVDAAMRQLWLTGWMHNRARMIAASFLIKHLLIDWRRGADWFWDTLVDANLANNASGWQWVAGSGADAAPYFRIFNPVTQGERYDADGAYVGRWIPELASLPAAFIHAPWTAPAEVLRHAGVALGENYPYPIVDHGEARARALAAFKSL